MKKKKKKTHAPFPPLPNKRTTSIQHKLPRLSFTQTHINNSNNNNNSHFLPATGRPLKSSMVSLTPRKFMTQSYMKTGKTALLRARK